MEKFVLGEYSTPALDRSLAHEASRLQSSQSDVVLRGLVACRLGLPLDDVSRLVDWRSFERFCGSVLAASGFETQENLVFTKPRMQLDVVASDPSVVISIDCKHWANSGGVAALTRAATLQIGRSRRLKERFPVGRRPVVSALVTMTDQPARFVSGAAVVPIHTLRDFAVGALSYSDVLELV